ncbi:Hypothetical_protein [Hexamita inflata]|uniref:Hypothetical_protein n=1 Tax=Hexamita inflata TaxID=28002 RepID=A0AA86TPN6_9EUKA|nr:Hypothetical protein HINF_LOCUS11656 [Hexamita inflata]
MNVLQEIQARITLIFDSLIINSSQDADQVTITLLKELKSIRHLKFMVSLTITDEQTDQVQVLSQFSDVETDGGIILAKEIQKFVVTAAVFYCLDQFEDDVLRQ